MWGWGLAVIGSLVRFGVGWVVFMGLWVNYDGTSGRFAHADADGGDSDNRCRANETSASYADGSGNGRTHHNRYPYNHSAHIYGRSYGHVQSHPNIVDARSRPDLWPIS